MKRNITAACALLSVTALLATGCASTSAAGSGAGGNTVTVWARDSEKGFINLLANAYNASHTTKVKVTIVPAANFVQKFGTAVASGSGPDVASIDLVYLPYFASVGALQDITDTADKLPYHKSLSAAHQKLATYNGRTYALPFTAEASVLYYNKTMLSTAGVAAPPSTWEAVAGLVPQVAKVSGQSVSNPLVALGTYANVHNARGIMSALFLQSGVPIAQASGSSVAVSLAGNGANGQTPGEAALRFYTSFANPAQPNYDWNASLTDSQQLFLSGQLALYLGYASEFSYLKQANPNLNFDMAKFPQPATATSRADYGRIYAFAIPRTAHNQSGAFAAAIALSADDAETALTNAAGTLAPAKRSLLGAATQDPYAAIYDDQALIARGWLSPAAAQTDAIFGAMITSVITGAARADEAIATAERSLSAALK